MIILQSTHYLLVFYSIRNYVTIKDHDYLSYAMDNWYKFSDAFINSLASLICCELQVEISEIVDTLEGEIERISKALFLGYTVQVGPTLV